MSAPKKFDHLNWVKDFTRHWRCLENPPLKKQASLLIRGFNTLKNFRSNIPQSKHQVLEQPFDLFLLNCSSIYRKSRVAYLNFKGLYLPALASSSRILSSVELLDSQIQYSPVESEMFWQSRVKNGAELLRLRSFVTCVFHEQNHRLLWKMLPPSPNEKSGIRKYLNYAESLVIATDMALSDQLSSRLAPFFYLSGACYDFGTSVRSEISQKRQYRNYLQAVMYGTYLNLEGYGAQEIQEVIQYLYSGLGSYAIRAAVRACYLSRSFVEGTNIDWQRRNWKEFRARNLDSGSIRGKIHLSDDPLDHREQYLFAEKWFEFLGV